jgi:hypothetical protein
MAECIDGRSGLLYDYFAGEVEEDSDGKISLVSTAELVRLFWEVQGSSDNLEMMRTLKQLRALKRDVSPEYETAKDDLLSNHTIFRHWRRRGYES